MGTSALVPLSYKVYGFKQDIKAAAFSLSNIFLELIVYILQEVGLALQQIRRERSKRGPLLVEANGSSGIFRLLSIEAGRNKDISRITLSRLQLLIAERVFQIFFS